MKVIPKNIVYFQSYNKYNPNIINNFKTKSVINELGVDISSRAEFPINLLSNFADTNFQLDGVNIKSMEGFLQSLKTSDPDKQLQICSLSGLRAKGVGKKLNKLRNYDFKHLYWNGKKYNRETQEYNDLLKRAYKARYYADENFRFALEYTENRILKHSLGGDDIKRTLLTENEFVQILMQLRDKKGAI